MPIRGLPIAIPSGQVRNLQLANTPSIRLLNPNDGVCYVSLDQRVTISNWDHKFPSQSAGALPGPLVRMVSMLYLDQSGSGASGEIVVYPSQDHLQFPTFWAIGRALQSQVTTLDIQEGSIPAAPGSGITRLWSDVTGALFRLINTGDNRQVPLLDTSGTILNVGTLQATNDGNFGSSLLREVRHPYNTYVHVEQGLRTATVGAGAMGSGIITFTRAFSATPVVVVGVGDWPNNAPPIGQVYVASISTTQCTIWYYNPSAATATFNAYWTAIGSDAS